tara:strand:- start:798 stop:1757 length:960 start_codon:yes stop_codon:yes gene_type:complete
MAEQDQEKLFMEPRPGMGKTHLMAARQQQMAQFEQLKGMKIKTIRGLRGSDGYIELPVLASTSLDHVLCETRGQRSAMQKRRLVIRRTIGWEKEPQWMKRQSQGRGKAYALSAAPMLLMMQASTMNVKRTYFALLTDVLARYVFKTYQKKTYQHLLELCLGELKTKIGEMAKEHPDQSTPIAELVNEALLELFATDQTFRTAAEDYSDCMVQAAVELPGFDRLTGQVVRVDDDQAMIAIDRGDDIEFRYVDVVELEPFGLDKDGAAFVLFEQSGIPGQQLRLFQPAIVKSLVSEKALVERNKAVEKHIKTLDDLDVPVY